MKTLRKAWISFSDAAPSLTFVAIGGFMIAAGIWIVRSGGSLSTVLVILGSGQLTLGIVISRIESFSLGLGGVRGVLRAVEKKGRRAGLDRYEIGDAAADAVALAFHSPFELTAAVAGEIADQAIERGRRGRMEVPETSEEETRRAAGALDSAEEETRPVAGALDSAGEETRRRPRLEADSGAATDEDSGDLGADPSHGES